jgi:hypothetical protein
VLPLAAVAQPIDETTVFTFSGAPVAHASDGAVVRS